ncbi:MAG: hypothetical protein E2590_07235 [Chryseobacterium sp.]|nr:hypothetical protein [Chryseobacterium sp.]
MVDVIRFYVENVELSKDVKKKFGRFYSDERFGNEFCYYKKPKNKSSQREAENSEIEDGKKRDYDHFEIKFVKPKDKDQGKLWFEQNIRRNYFDRTRTDESDYDIAASDLNYTDFVKEIEHWADEFGIDKDKFWKAKVTQVELGVTLHFKTSMLGVFSCFGSLKKMSRKHIYENFGVKFIGNNYQVSVYDKLERAFQRGEILKRVKTVKRNKVKEEAKKVKAHIRYEIKITTVSGILPDGLKNINSLNYIKENWNSIGDVLLKKFDDFTFVDVLSPGIEKEIIYQQFKKDKEDKGRRQNEAVINDYLKYLGMEAVGMEEFRQYIYPLLKKKNRTIEEKYLGLYEKFREKKKPSYSELFRKVLVKKIKTIQNMD